MTPISRGIAYGLWRRVQERAAELGLNGVQLAETVGIHRSTLNGLRSSTRPPQPRLIDKLVDGLGLDRAEAYRLAGRVPPQDAEDSADIRQLIRTSPYTDAQRQVLLNMLDAFDAANRETRPEGGTADT